MGSLPESLSEEESESAEELLVAASCVRLGLDGFQPCPSEELVYSCDRISAMVLIWVFRVSSVVCRSTFPGRVEGPGGFCVASFVVSVGIATVFPAIPLSSCSAITAWLRRVRLKM